MFGLTGLFVIIFLMIFFFALLEKYHDFHPALVAFGALLLLVVFKYLPSELAFSGFSNRAALTVLLTLLCAQSFEVAGGMDAIGILINRFKSKSYILNLILAKCTILSAFTNNITAMYLMLPIGKRICRDLKIPTNQFVMGLAFSAMFGGMLTAMGTPPNLIINDMRREELGISCGLFYETPLMILIALIGLITIFLSAKYFLPVNNIIYSGDFKRDEYLFAFRIKKDLHQSFENLCHKNNAYKPTGLAVKVKSTGQIELVGAESINLYEGDIIVVKCVNPKVTKGLSKTLCASILSLEILQDLKLLHVIEINEGSKLVGQTPEDLNLFSTQDIRLLASAASDSSSEDGIINYHQVGSLKLTPNTSYLVLAKPDKVKKFISKQFLSTEIEDRNFAVKPFKIFASAGGFLLAVIASNLELIPLEIALSICLFGNYFCGNLKIKNKILVDILLMVSLVAIMIPIGIAIEQNKAAEVIANSIIWSTSFIPFLSPEIRFLAGILCASVIIANVTDNSAAALMMLPIAVSGASIMNVSPNPYFSGIWIGVSTTFLLSISHNVTFLAQQECRYKTTDFLKFGGILTVVTIISAMILIPIFREF